jgi:hypothetical protein
MLMNRLVTTLALAGLAFGTCVFADAAPPGSSMTKRQAMKDCIEQQKTVNMSMSKAEMKRICKDKLKDQKATGDMPQQPATDAPHN